MTTHDYPTRKVQGGDLDETMVLVGESGGLSAIYRADPSSAMPGLTVVETEHGPLYLDPDAEYDIYDDGQLEDINTADGTAIDDPALADSAALDRAEWEWDNHASKLEDMVARDVRALTLYKDLKVLRSEGLSPENEQRARDLQARIAEEAFGLKEHEA